MRQAGEDQLRPRDGGIAGLHEVLAFDHFAGSGVGGGKGNGGPRVAGEEPQQLLADVSGGPEDTHGHRCMIMHRYGKLYTPT